MTAITARLVAELDRRLARALPAAKQKPSTYCFRLYENGQAEAVCVLLGDGRHVVREGDPPQRPTLTVELSAADAVALAEGRLEPMSAYFGRRIKLSGDFAAAVRLGQLLR